MSCCHTYQPQLKSSSCSSAIPRHNSRDTILSHNLRNDTCLTSIPSHNSRDTFRDTTQGTPVSRPSRYHQNLVDHAHPKHANTSLASALLPGTAFEPPNDIRFQTAQRKTRTARCQAPSSLTALQLLPGGTISTARRHACRLPSEITAITWRFAYYRQVPYQYLHNTNYGLGSSFLSHTLSHIFTQPIQLSYHCTIILPIIPYHHHNYQVKKFSI